ILDREGEVLESAPSPPPGLVVLAGPPPTVEDGRPVEPGARVAVSRALKVAAFLPSGLRAVVRAVEVGEEDSGELWLLVAEDGRIRLGGTEQLSAKLLAVATVLGQIDVGCVATLDVRVPTAPVLTRAGHCA
ncbi:MAG: cell division protein FtsQ/DivIB, partial [Acidimicrobiales bacterium]